MGILKEVGFQVEGHILREVDAMEGAATYRRRECPGESGCSVQGW